MLSTIELHVEYESVGCYEDRGERAIENAASLEYYPFGYSIYYFMKGNEIQKCALFAKLIGYKVFAIQNGGECLTSATAHKTYSKYGESQVCKGDGKGGPFANQVYRLSERKGILFYVLCCCCCFFLFLSWVFIVFIRNLDLVPSLHFLEVSITAADEDGKSFSGWGGKTKMAQLDWPIQLIIVYYMMS